MEYESCYRQVARPKYDCLLFDLDDTLYPFSSGLATACCNNIQDYMVEKLGIDRSIISELGNLLYKNYGTTMAGLRAIGYDFDFDEYHSFVHGRLPYENLKPDPVLRSLLLSLPIRKVIFTNADKVHAAKALSRLELEDCFEGIICFETLNPTHKSTVSDDEDDIQLTGSRLSSSTTTSSMEIFDIIGHFSQPNAEGSVLPKTPIVCKPSELAIEKALKIGNINPQRTLFFEDSVRNIQSGKCVGLDTVLVGTSQRIKGADYALESIHNIKEALPELWVSVKKASEVGYSGKALNPTHKSTVSDDEDDIQFTGSRISSSTATSRAEIFDIIGHFSQPNASRSVLPKTPCRPSGHAIEKAFKIGNISPQRTVGTKGADYGLESIHNIKEALPELLVSVKKSYEVGYSGKVAVETSMTA